MFGFTLKCIITYVLLLIDILEYILTNMLFHPASSLGKKMIPQKYLLSLFGSMVTIMCLIKDLYTSKSLWK